mgnify:CR=1 FL=1
MHPRQARAQPGKGALGALKPQPHVRSGYTREAARERLWARFWPQTELKLRLPGAVQTLLSASMAHRRES